MNKLSLILAVNVLFITDCLAHKTGYKHNHGGGNGNNVPEIDGNSIMVCVTILVCVYILCYFTRKK